MWEFTDIRERAIQELSEDKDAMGPIDKIDHGRGYNVKTWEMEGYIELLKRAKTITDEEAERLGWKPAAILLRLREQYLASIASLDGSTSTCVKCHSSSCPNQLYRYCNTYSYHACTQQSTNRDLYDFVTAVKKELGAETGTAGDQV